MCNIITGRMHSSSQFPNAKFEPCSMYTCWVETVESENLKLEANVSSACSVGMNEMANNVLNLCLDFFSVLFGKTKILKEKKVKIWCKEIVPLLKPSMIVLGSLQEAFIIK